jgi:hypothetical protein
MDLVGVSLPNLLLYFTAWILNRLRYEVSISWGPSYFGVGGNEQVNRIVKNAAVGTEFLGVLTNGVNCKFCTCYLPKKNLDLLN